MVFHHYLQIRHLPWAQARTSFNSPVSAIRRPRRDAVNIDIWFHAQNRLVFPFGRHLELISMDVSNFSVFIQFVIAGQPLVQAPERQWRQWCLRHELENHASRVIRSAGEWIDSLLWKTGWVHAQPWCRDQRICHFLFASLWYFNKPGDSCLTFSVSW